MKTQQTQKNHAVSSWIRRWRGLTAVAVLSVLTACGGGGGAEVISGGVTNLAPTQLALMEASSSTVGSLSISWLPATDDTTPAAQIKYQVHVSTDAGFTPSASTLVFEGTGVLSANITSGLVAGATYAVRLVAVDKNGASAVSKVMQVRVSDTTAVMIGAAPHTTLQAAQVASVTPTAVVLQAGVVAPAVGQIISSADANGGQGFLRKVTAVTNANGTTTLTTQSLALNEVFSDLQIASTVNMTEVPQLVANAAVQGGLTSVGTAQNGLTPTTFSWPATSLRYRTSVRQLNTTANAAARQAGVVANFSTSNGTSVTGKWGKVSGNSQIEIAEGGSGTNLLAVTITDQSTPWNSSTAVGVCKVTLGATTGSGNGSNPAGLSITLGTWDVVQSVAADGRVKTAHQTLNISAAKGTATDAPYKIKATAWLDDIGDGCSGDNLGNTWRESIDFELEIRVTTDNFPVNEPAQKTFTGSTGFTVDNSIVTSFNPKLTFEKSIKGKSLQSATVQIQASPQVTQTLTVKATAQGTMDKTLEIIPDRTFYKVYVAGGIPIVISGKFRMDMRIQGDVSGELNATEKFTIGYDNVSFGVKYVNGGFEPIQSAVPVYNLRVGGDGKAQANLTLSLLPNLEITGYEVLTAKVVLEPYLTAAAGIEGLVNLETDVDFNALQVNMAADADFRLTKTSLSGGLKGWLYADLHVWDYTLAVWPKAAVKADYQSYHPVDLISEKTFMDLPTLSAQASTDAGNVHPSNSCAIKVSATATDLPNPLKNLFPLMDSSFITWQRWTAPRIIAPIGVAASSYKTLPDPNGDAGVAWVVLSTPETYTVRVGGYSEWGTWARQYTEVQIDATDANGNGIPDWWEARYGLTGSGAAIASGDANGNGKTNLQEWQQCSDPVTGSAMGMGTIHASPTSTSVQKEVLLWITNAYQAVKSIVWNFGAGMAEQTAAVVNGISTSVSQIFSSTGVQTVTANYQDAQGHVLGQSTITIAVLPTAIIAKASSDSATAAGPIAYNGSTDDTTPTLSGLVSEALTAGQKVNVYDGDYMFTTTAVVNGLDWSFTPMAPLTAGEHRFTAEVASFDGRPGARSSAYVVNVLPGVTGISKLTDTGISLCYQAGGGLVSCTSAEALALNDQQDGMTGRDVANPNNADGRLGFSYSTVGSYPITDCVKDNITGLIWEGKTATGLRAGTNAYTNYDNTAVAQVWNGSTWVNPTQADIDAPTNAVGYQKAVNARALCGYTDWRLPTADELQSLVDYSVAYPGLMIDTTWFPNTAAGWYWSASPYAGDAAGAWVVEFVSGIVGIDLNRGDGGQVRLVR